MGDLINRKATIDSICRTVCDNPEICESPCDEKKVLEIMPPAQPETHDKRTETHGVCLDVIDRQATLDWLKNEWNGMITSLFDGIKALPSAQPEVLACGEGELIAQPEIIRCNDCKHWTQTTGNMRGFGLGDCDYINAKLVNCNGFCYWAERRTDGV